VFPCPVGIVVVLRNDRRPARALAGTDDRSAPASMTSTAFNRRGSHSPRTLPAICPASRSPAHSLRDVSRSHHWPSARAAWGLIPHPRTGAGTPTQQPASAACSRGPPEPGRAWRARGRAVPSRRPSPKHGLPLDQGCACARVRCHRRGQPKKLLLTTGPALGQR
jgi:hypothetical protein